MMTSEMIMKIVVKTWKMPSQNLQKNMNSEVNLVNKPPTPKPLTNLLKTALQTKPKTVKQKEKIVAINSGKGKEKDTQNIEKQSANISSTNT